jgi:exodeoxyribonuclease V alpha subunit
VDEASMIDIPMFARLLSATGTKGRVVLLGDKDQLASVEAGSLLGDLCPAVPKGASLNRFSLKRMEWLNSFIRDADRRITPFHVYKDPGPLHEGIVELAYSHRVKEAPRIRELSRAILNNDVPGLEGLMAEDGVGEFVFDASYDPMLLEQFVSGYAGYIEEKNPLVALKKLNALRVLATVREGPKGLYAMNRRIEEILAAKKLIRTGRTFYENRPVIVTRNNYETRLFNGDVGIVRMVKKVLRVFFETEGGGLRDIPPAYLSNCETVFAMTIHKSQGSEFENVMVVLPEGTDSPLLTRELLYTGITRAKRRVVVSGSMESVLHACGTSVRRISGISDRLQG